MSYPSFFTTPEFADLYGLSLNTVKHGAANYLKPDENNANELPTGWGSFRFGRFYLIYMLSERAEIRACFHLDSNMERNLDA